MFSSEHQYPIAKLKKQIIMVMMKQKTDDVIQVIIGQRIHRSRILPTSHKEARTGRVTAGQVE